MGSEDLFRPTRPAEPEPEAKPDEIQDDLIKDALAPRHPIEDTPREKLIRTLHFSPGEIDLLLEAVQMARFADKSHPKPSLEKFERLGELRLKLQGE